MLKNFLRILIGQLRYTIVLVSSISITDSAFSNPVVPSINEVIANIEKQEQMLQNIYVKSIAEVDEALPAKPGNWIKTPKLYDLQAWINGSVDGPFRLEVSRDVVDWKDGVNGEKYSERKYSVSYDGKKIIYILKGAGWPGDIRDPRQAELVSDPTNFRQSAAMKYGAGTVFCPNYWDISKHITLSVHLKAWLSAQKENQKDKPFATVELAEIDGSQIVKVTFGYMDSTEHTWCFDPARGWGMLSYVASDGGKVYMSLVVKKLQQVDAALWYPIVADMTFEPDGADPGIRYRYVANEVKANEPSIEAAIGNLQIIPGTGVTDKIENKVFQVASPDNETSRSIDSALREAIRAATMPSTQPFEN